MKEFYNHKQQLVPKLAEDGACTSFQDDAAELLLQ